MGTESKSETNGMAPDAYTQIPEVEVPLQKPEVERKAEAAPTFGSARWCLAIMYFTGCITIYLMRANLSVAIVCMNSDPEVETYVNSTSASNVTSYDNSQAHDGHQEGEFQWSRLLRGLILSGFYIGYSSAQPPCGWLTTKVGGKWLMFTGILIMTFLTFLSPVAARFSPYALLSVQIGKGLSCSVFYTSVTYLLGVWAPPTERSKLTAVGNSGSLWGTVLGFSISGLLCEHGFDGGWPSVFYVYGIVAIVWLCFWAYFVYDSPAQHPRISKAEREYIESSLEGADQKTPPVPWKAMLTSRPFYAILVADFTYSFMWYTILTSLPQYMKDVFNFSIKKNGVLSAIPYVASWVVALISSFGADYLIERKILRVVVVRKMAFGLALTVSSVLLIVISFLGPSQSALGVTFMTLAMAGLGFIRSAHYANMLDIAPRFSGLVMGISNSNVSGFIAPVISGALVHHGTREEWQYVFIVTSVIALVGVVVYSVFAQGVVQDWARVEDKFPAVQEVNGNGVHEMESKAALVQANGNSNQTVV